MDKDEIKDYIEKNVNFDLNVPPPAPEMILTDLKLLRSSYPFIKINNQKKINKSTLLQILDTDFYSMARSELKNLKQNASTEEESKISCTKQKNFTSPFKEIQGDALFLKPKHISEVSYVDILHNSFWDIKNDIDYSHPLDNKIEVDVVYELDPYPCKSKYDLLAIEEIDADETLSDFDVIEYKKSVPSLIEINQEQYNVLPLDISEYLFLEFTDKDKEMEDLESIEIPLKKAYFRSIGAKLKLKKQQIKKLSKSDE